ncbi:MAG TPA: hypothetical protein VNL16_08505 [Chloroflexota bacterium]|nr:hypothetical protein [Chloroflexota bacterium]
MWAVAGIRWLLSRTQSYRHELGRLVDFIHRFASGPTTDALLDPIVALGSALLARIPVGAAVRLRRVSASGIVALAVGLLALPITFLRGLHPRHDPFPRRLES